MNEHKRSCCSSFHRAIELVGRRWTGVIVYMLTEGPSRFAALSARIPDITPRMLTERLRELELEGIVERSTTPESPYRVEYALTKKGHDLADALRGIGAWARRWLPNEARTRTTTSRD